MLYFKFRWLFILILFVVGGYYLILFFGKLTDINIFSAIAWGFQSGVTVGKGFPVWLFLLLAFLLYPFLFTAVFLFLEIPMHVCQMKNNHTGGLMGYSDGYEIRVYDPSRNAYFAYEYLDPPPTASKFTDAFEVVLFYKFRPSSKYYRGTKLRSLSSHIASLFVATLGLFMIYISFYLLAEAYIGENGLQIQLSHQSLAVKFQQITGVTALNALLIALSVYVLVLGAGIISVKKINNLFRSFYASDQQALKSKLLNSVSPMDTITGRVISRRYKTEGRSHLEGSEDNTGHSVGRGNNAIYYTEDAFTVEFRDLIHIPVYLDLTIIQSKSARKEEKMPNSLFPDEETNEEENEDVPKKMVELDFIVNPDYSVSLKRDENR